MKIIQALIVLFAVVGCLALALGGFFLYNMSQNGGENFLSKLKQARATQAADQKSTAPVAAAPDSQYANIIKEYSPTPTPTPLPQQVSSVPGAPAPAQPQVAMQVISAPAAKPIKTPKPDEGKIRNWPSIGQKWVALTYDDGPHPEWTQKMIELLKSKNVKATFFLLGQEVEKHPEIARDLVANGFEIGNHTWDHKDCNNLSPEKIREELESTNKVIAENVTKSPITLMRPPYGNSPQKMETILEDLGLYNICWNIDTDDWRSKTEAKDMVNNIMKNLSNGSIILMHDRHEKTYDTTAEVIDKIRAEGYEFVTVSELLGIRAHTKSAAPPPPAPAAAVSANTTLPAPPAAAAGQGALPPVSSSASGASSLPAPSAAQATPVQPTGEALDSSKITKLPPQR